MNKTTKITAALVALAAVGGAAGVALSAQADGRWHDRQGGARHHLQQAYGGPGMHGRHDHGGRHGMHHGSHRKGGRHMTRLLESFDANDDGKLSQEEIDQRRVERFSAFDADGSQSLSLAEYEKLWLEAMREVMVDRFQHLDADGDAQITAEEFKRPFAKTVRRMDRNEDGVIDRNDFRRHLHRGGKGSPPEDSNG